MTITGFPAVQQVDSVGKILGDPAGRANAIADLAFLFRSQLRIAAQVSIPYFRG